MNPRGAAAAALLGALAIGALTACGSTSPSTASNGDGVVGLARAFDGKATAPAAAAPARPSVAAPVKVAVKPTVAKAVPSRPSAAKRAVSVAHRAPQTSPTAVRRTRIASTTVATSAVTSSYLTGCDGTSGWQRRRGNYALRRISYNWRALGYSINFMGARAGLSGMTYPSSRRIEVYVRSCSRMTTPYLAETIAHEIGHALDFTRGTTSWHKSWQTARHIPLTMPWYGTPYANDFATPAGDFAESFAAWQVPDGPNDSHWGRPSRAQMLVLIPLFKI
ncbi:MAG: hypothetical protein QOK42_1680 [Frankiaceae bacterium]|jgi:hypothetical protein|nr:hypothetical protein [Frankiaceae bacterium]